MFKKVLILGSGALKIGQAGEFDYSGSQALKALKEEGIQTVLINPNIATFQTSPEIADKIYFLPITPYFIEEVIKKEQPDGILLGFGGQTALNCGLDLARRGILDGFKVKVLGTSTATIEVTEDRKQFAKYLSKIGVKIPKGGFARTKAEALRVVKRVGFPVIIRSAFSLGGLGSAIAVNPGQFLKAIDLALSNAPQISIEEYLEHWKEVEYEVVRDESRNKLIICNMENLDPLGIHTGESIVVAPSQTLNNYQYHFLRQISLKVIEGLGIVGECNIQFALDPKSNDYRVIEVNARLSRSSALASKATGYPLAYIAAKLAIGRILPNLTNSVTKSTSAFFEPALDYVVIKIPKWDLQKFAGAEDSIGPSMKSVGEVMAIGRSFEESLQKAIRMVEPGADGLVSNEAPRANARGIFSLASAERNLAEAENSHSSTVSQPWSSAKADKELLNMGSKNGYGLKKELAPSVKRLFKVARQLAAGTGIKEIYKSTGIDCWFLERVERIVIFRKMLAKGCNLNRKTLTEAKRRGFSDKVLAQSSASSEQEVRALRKKWKITPVVKHIDTLAAEYPAQTNYLYLTYNATDSEIEQDNRKKVIVLGSGPYHIGSSVEFDWCAVTATQTFRQRGMQTIMVNCNPETVSTDFDYADKLYFEELTLERISDIYEIEQGASLVLSFGGQIPNNLAMDCHNRGYQILGTTPQNIDRAEDRNKFSRLLDRLGISQPEWKEVNDLSDAKVFIKKIGYPVLLRPSYVLSGSAMNVAMSRREFKSYLQKATIVSDKHPVVISRFIENAKEIEIDGVAQNGELIIYAISEHLENAGVHSGDATLILPAQRLFLETIRQIKQITRRIIKELDITGPFNIQFLAKDNKVLVIELNLRASRSFPFASKVLGINFIELAVKAMLGESLSHFNDLSDLDYVAVKAPQFSFNRLIGADPRLRVEMSSTGEVACFGDDFNEAYLKALLSTGWKMPVKNIFISIGSIEDKQDYLESAQKLSKLKLKIFATSGTSRFLADYGIENTVVYKISENKNPTILDFIKEGKIDVAVNISKSNGSKAGKDGFMIRRSCADLNIPLFTNMQAAKAFVGALQDTSLKDLEIKSRDEYVDI